MKAAILDNENKIVDIILLQKMDDHPDAKFLSDTSPLKVGDVYTDELAKTEQSIEQPELKKISIDTISPKLEGYDEEVNQYTVNEQTAIAVSGTVESENKKFRVPFKRTDTGRTQIMSAEIVDGKFTINLNFKTSGKWVINTDLLNSELSQPIFEIEQQTFFVI